MIRFRPLTAAAFVAGALTLTAAGTPTSARQPAAAAKPAPVAKLSAADRAKTLSAIRDQVQTLYVFPEKRAAIVQRLTEAEKAGRYDLDAPVAFAEAVTRDLMEASHDKHMYLTFDVAQYAARTATTIDTEADAQQDAYWRARAIREHHGLGEMKILDGNIRYLKITSFHWVDDQTGPAYDAAARFLKDGDAIVIDLRGNGGGSGAAVNYLTSHFLKSDTLLLTFLRGSDVPVQSRTLGNLPGGRLTGKPLYVLIDGGCFSACEEFAYHVQQFKLGELLGVKTGGGANNNDLVPIAPGFMLSVSAGRPVHAISGTNWEGVGIAPDTETPPARALDVTLQRALTKLAASPAATPETRAAYEWARTDVTARLTPVTIPAERLRPLAGAYGDATVTYRDGSLWLKRGERPERRLAPLDDKGLFGAEGNAMLRARFAGDKLELLWQGAPSLTFKRS